MTATRATSEKGDERVFITTDDGVQLILTPTEAADLGEALQRVSGMATSTRGAPFLAQIYRNDFVREGVTQARASREAGIPLKRLRHLLRGEQPMTMTEQQGAVGGEGMTADLEVALRPCERWCGNGEGTRRSTRPTGSVPSSCR